MTGVEVNGESVLVQDEHYPFITVEQDQESKVLQLERCRIIRKVLMGLLPPDALSVLRLRYGIGCRRHTLASAGRELGISPERVRQVQNKAFRILYRSKALRIQHRALLPERRKLNRPEVAQAVSQALSLGILVRPPTVPPELKAARQRVAREAWEKGKKTRATKHHCHSMMSIQSPIPWLGYNNIETYIEHMLRRWFRFRVIAAQRARVPEVA
jgi:hypothetical protein